MPARGRIHIGTSGWSYAHWHGPFYPEDLPAGQQLVFYAQTFGSVEINSSFYRLPEPATVQHWADSTPDDFLFTVKASRYITHMKKLKDPDQGVPLLLERVSGLGGKLGPILFQLPPRWRCNHDRLRDFLASLDEGFRYAFEFRDPSWLNTQTLSLLEQHSAAFCIYELAGYRTPDHVTTDFVYVRLHGPGDAYAGSYPDRVLRRHAEQFSQWTARGRHVYCYFDNDEAGYAARNARRLQTLLTDM